MKIVLNALQCTKTQTYTEFYWLERSRSSVKVTNLFIRPLPFTYKYTCEVSLSSYCQFCSCCRAIITKR